MAEDDFLGESGARGHAGAWVACCDSARTNTRPQSLSELALNTLNAFFAARPGAETLSPKGPIGPKGPFASRPIATAGHP